MPNKEKAQIVEQTSVQQNFVRSQKIEQTDGQEHSHTRTLIFANSASNFQLREICSIFFGRPKLRTKNNENFFTEQPVYVLKYIGKVPSTKSNRIET